MGAFKYLFKGFFEQTKEIALFALVDVLQEIHHFQSDVFLPSEAGEDVDLHEANNAHDKRRTREGRKLKYRIIEALCFFEKEFPITKMVSQFHNLIHVPETILRWNHVRNYWAFFSERCVGWLTNFIHNRKDPAVNLINSYSYMTLTRRAPLSIRKEYELMCSQMDVSFGDRGHLVSTETLLAGKDSFGTGEVVVKLSRRNSKLGSLASIPQELVTAISKFNKDAVPYRRIPLSARATLNYRCWFMTAGLKVSGRDLKNFGFMWKSNGRLYRSPFKGFYYIENQTPPYESAVFLRVFKRAVVQREPATLMHFENNSASDYQYIHISKLTHQTRFVKNIDAENPNSEMCLLVKTL